MPSRFCFRFLQNTRKNLARLPQSSSAITSPPLGLNYTGRRTASTMLSSPLNMPKWLEENSHLLKPPINNYCVYDKDVTVMIVGGPNARTDYHINETAEWFYQYRGSMLLRVVDSGTHRDIPIREGEMFLLPPNTPHNPIRFADTVGIVIEQPRPADSKDRLRWYCQNCGEVVHEAAFHCIDLGTQIKEAVVGFEKDQEGRTCGKCGEVVEMVPKGVVQP